jgi:hypothetical protein
MRESKSRRSVRGFKDQPVSREVLERVLSARIEHSAVEHLRADRRAARRTQDTCRRTRGPRRPDDWEARQRAAIANWNCFGAPAASSATSIATGPAPMGRRRHVFADHHAAPRRRAAQLPADGVVAGSRDSRGGPVTSRRPYPLLRYVNRVRRSHGDLRPYGPRPLNDTVTFVDDSALAARASELEQTKSSASVTEA